MAGGAARVDRGDEARVRPATRDPGWVRALLIAVAVGFIGLFVLMPLVVVFSEALSDGPAAFARSIADEETLHALGLSLLTAVLAVPLNVVFGVAAAWAIARFDFPGKSALVTLIDLPFAVSPVVSGMIFVLLLGTRGVVGPYLEPLGIRVIFALPGIVIATAFVTFPFIARELIPFWQAQGPEQEEAAITLGASGWTTLFRVSLPTARYALLYGVVLATARALGEFGAVSVVSGHIRGRTNTLPLHIEILYGEFQYQSAFTAASLFAVMGLGTLAAKYFLERRMSMDRGERSAGAATSS
jgi:sulfate transport system permease protein